MVRLFMTTHRAALGLAAIAAAAVLTLGAAAPAPPPAPAPPAPPPSILLVTIDTLRADHVGAYGRRPSPSPHLDRLAARGTRFTDARAHVPLTLPSHATLLTGLLPPRHGLRANGLGRLPEAIPTLAGVLRARGYRTGAVVASVVLDRAHGLDRGFDFYDDNQRVGDRAAFQYAERGASQVASAAEATLAKLAPPFFLWVHLYDPHRPWVAPPRLGRGYDAEISFADEAMEAVREAADGRAGGKLLVAVTSDHGESLGAHGEDQHGYTIHRGVMRVPLVLAGPDVPRGRAIGATVGLIDLAPTLAELAGTRFPEPTDGTSLRAAFREGARAEAPLELWQETLHPLFDSGWAPLRGLLTDRWNFVDAPKPRLFARRDDPDDRKDVAAAHPKEVSALRRRLLQRMAAMGDVPEPAPPRPPEGDDPERLARLASLGYLAAPPRPSAGTRLDPAVGLPGFRARERADVLLSEGKAKEAVALLTPFAAKDRDNPRLHHGLARALAADGRLDAALTEIDAAIALSPREEFLRYTRASILLAKGDEARGTAELQGILAANPRAIDAALDLARLAVQRKDLGEARRLLEAAHAAGARDPEQLVLLGSFAQASGDGGAAVAWFEQALALQPNLPVALLETGRAALRDGRTELALSRFQACTDGARAFECRMELARAYLTVVRDVPRGRLALESAGEVARDGRQREEVRRRLASIAGRDP